MTRIPAFLALLGALAGCTSHQGAVRPAVRDGVPEAADKPVATGEGWATLTVQTGEASVRLADRWTRLDSGSEPMKGVPVRAAITIPVGSRVQLTFPSSRPGIGAVGELPDAADGFMALLAGMGAAPVASGSAIVVSIEGPARLRIGGDPELPLEGILSVAHAQRIRLNAGRGSDSFHVRLGDRILLRTAPGGTDLVANRNGARMSMVNLGESPVVFLTGSRAEDMITVASGETILVPVAATSGLLMQPERRWIGALALISSPDTALELLGTRGRLTSSLDAPTVAHVSGTALGLAPGRPWVIESWVKWQ